MKVTAYRFVAIAIIVAIQAILNMIWYIELDRTGIHIVFSHLALVFTNILVLAICLNGWLVLRKVQKS